ncbi:pentapeptide repeat-containing protein [Streptomyces lydicus]|uniref:pentapeptide repeat-containing protein n=1 Tax=Streptomyces lydicus TaxID=47763 RepID=UPI0037CE199A
MTKNLGMGRLRRIADRYTAGQNRQKRARRFATGAPAGGDRMQWVGLVAVSLPGLAALAALLFTWMQVGQASEELRISEQGQITNRFNAAITNLGSPSTDVRLGGIYALQRIMQDSIRDHPTVVSVLSAYVRQHAPLPASDAKKSQATSAEHSPGADIQAVMNVLAHRRPDFDRGVTVDLSRTDLRGLKPMVSKGETVNLRGANLTDADLREADLAKADLHGAGLSGADFRDAWLPGATLTKATLSGTDLSGARLLDANLTKVSCDTSLVDPETGKVVPMCPDLTGAYMNGVKLVGAYLATAKLRDADLTGADLTGANLTGADLTDAYLAGANLTRADLTGARLKGVTWDGAKRDGTRGLPASVR